MKTKLIVGLGILFAVVLINACENKRAPAPLTIEIPNSCDTTNLTYSSGSNTMQAIINVQCGATLTSCHSPGSISGYDYTRYATIYANYQKGWLYSTIFQGTPNAMPKIAQPGWGDPCMMAKFRAWIRQGCPQ